MQNPHRIAPCLLALGLAASALACVAAPSTSVSPARIATTVVLVRHAEKSTDDPRDPSLSVTGQERARALSAVLSDAGIADIYVTQYKRTRQTAEPLAQQLGAAFVERPINSANSATYAHDLAQEILARSAGRAALVVGHSNTIPDIVKAVSGFTVAPIEDDEYDHIYVVVIPATGPAKLVTLRYGTATVHAVSGQ